MTLTELSQFTGTETYYRHPLFRALRYTDGEYFQAWTLTRQGAVRC